MKQPKTRILHITNQSGPSLMLTMTEGKVFQANTPETFTALANRGADLIIIDLDIGNSLLRFADVISNFRNIPLMAIGKNENEWNKIAGNTHIKVYRSGKDTDQELRRTAISLIEKGRFLRGEICLIGQSDSVKQLRERVLMIADTPVSTVLLTGESGSGKDEVARAIHSFSNERSEGKFKPINCAAIPENLLENELFGHEKGSFTDAKSLYRGIFEQAQKGTIFLDEIAEMAPAAQVRLLRVLEDRKINRIGGDDAISVDVRIIAATNQDLQEAVNNRTFRLDLYHRLKVVELDLPPLRRRPEDLQELIDHFVKQLAPEGNSRFERFSPESEKLLADYSWPGNVRELRNLIEHLVFLAPTPIVQPVELIPHLEQPPSPHRNLPIATNKSPDQSERELIYFALLDLKREVADLKNNMDEFINSNERLKPETDVRNVVYPQNNNAILSSPSVNENLTPLETKSHASNAIEPLRSLRDMEYGAIIEALNRVNNNRRKAADILGISARTLYRKLKEYEID
tara:strand:+ start:1396 stop:2946 length:1551 start_codon:yes stop_codon:yes gene_type:complete